MDTKVSVMPTDYSPAHWQAMKEMAKEFHAAGALPAHWNSAAKIVMGLQAGAEMGIPPIQALSTLYIVNGKIAMEGIAMLKKLRQGGVQVEWVESTDKKCIVKLTRPDDNTEHIEEFNMEDAKRAALDTKDTWKKYPKDQLRWKALSRAARFHAPDIVQGAYIVDDLADVNGSGVRTNEQGAIVVDVTNAVVEEILAAIKDCSDRQTYKEKVLPMISAIGSKLTFTERASITKAAESKMVEFNIEDARVKAKKDTADTKKTLETTQDELENEDGDTEPSEEEDMQEGEKNDESEDHTTEDAKKYEPTKEEFAKIVRKIRSFSKQTQIIEYVQGTLNTMPLNTEQKSAVREWVKNKIAQINSKVPDKEDMKMIFGY